MGSIVTASFENVSVSAAQDLFELVPDIHVPVVIHGVFIDNVGAAADAGDAQEEFLRIQLRYLSDITSGSGGAAAGLSTFAYSTVESNNTTIATAASKDALVMARGWNIRAPFEVIWTPETRPVIGFDQGDLVEAAFVVRLAAAPADAIAMSGSLVFEEIGSAF